MSWLEDHARAEAEKERRTEERLQGAFAADYKRILDIAGPLLPTTWDEEPPLDRWPCPLVPEHGYSIRVQARPVAAIVCAHGCRPEDLKVVVEAMKKLRMDEQTRAWRERTGRAVAQGEPRS